ncbi:MAG: hypothetical protein WBA76_07075 [Phormidesmis sp.]
MLERWKERDNLSILNEYFESGSNSERVESLRDAFIASGINVQPDVFDDYLAIKYIRNAIVHASWKTSAGNVKQNQLDWIVERGFPSDTRKLTSEHWQRFEWVDENMMFYIALTGMPGVQPRPDLDNVGVSPRPLPDTRGIIPQSSWPRIYWSNLERISSAISTNIEKAATIPEFSWSQGLTDEQIEDMSHNEKKQRFYSSAYAAAKQGFEPLQDTDGYADNAVWCWSQFVEHVVEFKDLETSAVEAAVASFRSIHENNIHPKNHIFPPLHKDTPLSIREELVAACFESVDPLTTREVAEAYAIGEKAKRAIMNVVPLKLFAIQLPILAPERYQEWQEIARYIIDVFEVGQSWDTALEGRSSPRATIDFYRQMNTILSEANL